MVFYTFDNHIKLQRMLADSKPPSPSKKKYQRHVDDSIDNNGEFKLVVLVTDVQPSSIVAALRIKFQLKHAKGTFNAGEFVAARY